MIIIRDTREKEYKGWYFEEDGFCHGTLDRKMDTGDYTIEGKEGLICIERKGAITEFAANCVQDRFKRELARMSDFQHAYLILEFDMFDLMRYPQTAAGVVARKTKITGKFILKCLHEFEMEYGIKSVLAGNFGKEVAYSVLKRVEQNN